MAKTQGSFNPYSEHLVNTKGKVFMGGVLDLHSPEDLQIVKYRLLASELMFSSLNEALNRVVNKRDCMLTEDFIMGTTALQQDYPDLDLSEERLALDHSSLQSFVIDINKKLGIINQCCEVQSRVKARPWITTS
jgi:hypothetical protein